MELQLQDKRALVTGSTAGIGFAIAAELAREGARVVVNGRTMGPMPGASSDSSGRINCGTSQTHAVV